VIEVNKSLWIPIESTTLAKGFFESWKAASVLVGKYQGTSDFEFLIVKELREIFPPLPLPTSILPYPHPDMKACAALDKLSMASLEKTIYLPLVQELEMSRKTSEGKNWNAETNRQAQLNVKFGYVEKAIALLHEIITRDPSSISSYMNLAALSLRKGDEKSAVDILGAACEKFPECMTKLLAFSENLGLSVNAGLKARLYPAGIESSAVLDSKASPATMRSSNVSDIAWEDE